LFFEAEIRAVAEKNPQKKRGNKTGEVCVEREEQRNAEFLIDSNYD